MKAAPSALDTRAERGQTQLAFAHADEDERRQVFPLRPVYLERYANGVELGEDSQTRRRRREPVAEPPLETLPGPHIRDVGADGACVEKNVSIDFAHVDAARARPRSDADGRVQIFR